MQPSTNTTATTGPPDSGPAERGPLAELRQLVEAGAELEARLDAAMTEQVWVARSRDVSWTEIAAAVGITRQAAHKRWRHLDDVAAEDLELSAPSGSVQTQEKKGGRDR